MYAIHPPHVLACASILLTTRLLRIPLPPDWYVLFDVAWDDIWSCCGVVMHAWRDWGVDVPVGVDWGGRRESKEERKGREDRWRRAWILAESRRGVRRWVEEREREEGVRAEQVEQVEQVDQGRGEAVTS